MAKPAAATKAVDADAVTMVRCRETHRRARTVQGSGRRIMADHDGDRPLHLTALLRLDECL